MTPPINPWILKGGPRLGVEEGSSDKEVNVEEGNGEGKDEIRIEEGFRDEEGFDDKEG